MAFFAILRWIKKQCACTISFWNSVCVSFYTHFPTMDLRARTSKRQFNLNFSYSSFFFPVWDLQTCLYWGSLSAKSVCHAEYFFRILFLNFRKEKITFAREKFFYFRLSSSILKKYTLAQKNLLLFSFYIFYFIPELLEEKFFHCYLFVCVELLKTFLFLPPFLKYLMVWAPPSSSIVENIFG